MVQHKCIQEGNISDLKFKQELLMDMVKETNLNVKEIKAYIFEGGMEDKYSTKEEVRQSKELQDLKNKEFYGNIKELKDVQSRITWAVILGVMAFIGNAVIQFYLNK